MARLTISSITMAESEHANRYGCDSFIDHRWGILTALPSVLVGAQVMRLHSFPAKIWMQQIVVCALLTSLMLALSVATRRRSLSRLSVAVIVFGFSMLGLTFFDPGLQGVHRYFQIAGFRLNAGEMVLPSMIIALGCWPVLNRKNLYFITFAVMIILVAQPDAGRATAFAGAATFLCQTGSRRHSLVKNLLLVIGVTVAWSRSDPLGRVAYTEDIVCLAMEASTGWGLAALASLAALPVPFVLAAVRSQHKSSAALAAYFICSIFVPFLGNFPVPVLGYGASGMIGYFSGLLAIASLDRR